MNKRFLFLLSCLLVVGLLLSGSGPAFAKGDSDKSPVEKARDDLEQQVTTLPEVAGIAHSEDDGVITVFLETEHAKGKVPDSFRGFHVKKEVTGKFKAIATQVLEAPAPVLLYQVSPTRTSPVSPLVGGISVSALAGTIYIYAGTLGMVTYGTIKYILSNVHVIAMNPDTNDFLPEDGTTTIVQPGTLDLYNLGLYGNASSYKVGALYKHAPFKFGNSALNPNYADAAIASLTVGGNSGVQFGEKGNYKVSGSATVSAPTRRNRGETVKKSGRTSGVTQNTVSYTNWAGWVDYSTPYSGTKLAYFSDQILVKQPFIQAGDSGSVVANKNNQFVGLAFAASSTYAVANKAGRVISGLPEIQVQ